MFPQSVSGSPNACQFDSITRQNRQKMTPLVRVVLDEHDSTGLVRSGHGMNRTRLTRLPHHLLVQILQPDRNNAPLAASYNDAPWKPRKQRVILRAGHLLEALGTRDCKKPHEEDNAMANETKVVEQDADPSGRR